MQASSLPDKTLSKAVAGFSFVETVVAVGVSIIFFSGLIYFASTTRVETAKAGNYLRALQIAQETMELVQSAPLAEVMQNRIQIFEGSLIDPQTGQSIEIPINKDAAWQPSTKSYPEQYNNCFFYRKISVSQPAETAQSRFLKTITVEVFWNEGKTPDKIESLGSEPERMRKISLSTMLFDEKEPY
jgi:type II secretory pathway pseudopilin PulG